LGWSLGDSEQHIGLAFDEIALDLPNAKTNNRGTAEIRVEAPRLTKNDLSSYQLNFIFIATTA